MPPEAYWRQAAGLAPHEFCRGTASPMTNNPDHSIWLREFGQMAGAARRSCWTRVQTQLDPPDNSGSKNDGREEVAGELVVSCGDAAEILQAAEHTLDEVALTIGDRAVGSLWLAACA